ncbi:hydrogenase nickel incorporation protein HypB [Acerihabitans arboris]|uniref:Hydrogenase maturation factor HypB n=1 Tax=Acerihabitans arboris TaxID=2691583 RepID=A0A845SM81_9GAMM|nr:hydrogenase nickel incorporation protein HypB [Acerihabitans arboris]NDL64064.1 hydrogenase nickel incorporation protein HypB [Acerihabitans arboris]
MCSTCGCAEGERHIEGDDDQHDHRRDHHHHDHSHAHHDHPHHDAAHAVPAPRRISLTAAAPATVIHHHHYHGEVHNHYYSLAPGQSAPPPQAAAGHAVHHGDSTWHSAGNSAGQAAYRDGDTGGAVFNPQASAQGDLDYGQGAAGTHAPGLSQRRMVEIEIDVLDKNNRLAAHNREHFQSRNILALNLVSSPGSGKTTLLTETLLRLRDRVSCAVIEGDQQTTNDAERIRATGAPAIQVNTGKGCHLDAQMVHDAVHRLAPPDNSLLFIENVGNLVCPAGFDLGERHKVVVLSVTEGEDKPLKYPHMFAAAGLMILNKTDLLPWVQFDVDTCIANARRVNPAIAVLMVSATAGSGMDAWLAWLADLLAVSRAGPGAGERQSCA